MESICLLPIEFKWRAPLDLHLELPPLGEEEKWQILKSIIRGFSTERVHSFPLSLLSVPPRRISALLYSSLRSRIEMPKIKTSRVNYPDGWLLIKPTLLDLDAKMRQAENDPHDGKRKCEALWPIFHITHQKSRYIFDLYYKRQEISRELYEFCLEQGYADANLIAKWKKAGYERLCCLRCIQTRDHNFGTTCMCRVPKHLREDNKVIECVHCGCTGCASGD